MSKYTLLLREMDSFSKLYIINKILLKVVNNYKLLQEDFKGKIYSFPEDPILYILFNQIPPYNFSVYEASPLHAQKILINYIEDQKINYIIYNFRNVAIQDGVPNYIRAATLNAYIVNNFSIKTRVGKFLILQRNDGIGDFFKNKYLNEVSHLLQIDLASIPKSEGTYKRAFVKNANNIISKELPCKELIDCSKINI